MKRAEYDAMFAEAEAKIAESKTRIDELTKQMNDMVKWVTRDDRRRRVQDCRTSRRRSTTGWASTSGQGRESARGLYISGGGGSAGRSTSF